jgi:hypothetical protein
LCFTDARGLTYTVGQSLLPVALQELPTLLECSLPFPMQTAALRGGFGVESTGIGRILGIVYSVVL